MGQPPPVPERSAHPFLTYDMIREIPQTIQITLQRNRITATELAARLSDRTRTLFTGCGTAFYAAMLGPQFVLGGGTTPRSTAVQAFELARYDDALDGNSVVVAVSHSGITKTTVDALRHAKERGAYCIGISHFTDRPIGEVADRVLLAGNSPDRSRCHTKCYVAAATACAQLALELSRRASDAVAARADALKRELNRLPSLSQAVLEAVDEPCRQLAEQYGNAGCFYLAGAGPNVPTALEAGLKILETSFVPALAMETEQMLHGPWVSWNEQSVLIVLAPRGPSYARSVDLVRAAKHARIPTIAVVDQGDEQMAAASSHVIPLPGVDEQLTPLTYILPLYLLAYYASVGRGINPDYLRYLTPAYWAARQIIFPPGTH